MKTLPILALTLALSMGSAAVLHAQDVEATPPGDAPETKKAIAKPVRTPRMFGVWAKMGSLTPEQKQQIGAIHRKALDDKKAIDAQEKTDILALLTPEQQAEVDQLEDTTAAARKRKPAAPPAPAPAPPAPAAEPATQPADNGM